MLNVSKQCQRGDKTCYLNNCRNCQIKVTTLYLINYSNNFMQKSFCFVVVIFCNWQEINSGILVCNFVQLTKS